MTSRMTDTFARVREAGRGGLVTYLTAGDPDRDRSEGLLRAVAQGGADVLEVGVPFSDPLADGPVIQRATERALAGGMTLGGTLDLIQRVRRQVGAPIVLFTYANPVLRMGVDTFARRAADAAALTARVRACTDMPTALGFGIATPDHVAEACRNADAAVVGSALVNFVAEQADAGDVCERTSEYVRWLKSAL